MDRETVEILQIVDEAINLASAACQLDRQDHPTAAYEYYDQAILNIDEVMSRLPQSSAQWAKLMMIRIQYDDRMESLKDTDSRGIASTGSGSLLARGNGGDATPTSSIKQHRAMTPTRYLQRRKMLADDINFTEIEDMSEYLTDDVTVPPGTSIEMPYWILRNIQKTIEKGGFLNGNLYIPKRVWTQNDVKFSGVTAKMAAFEIIIKMVSTHVDGLYMSNDIDSMELADVAFINVLDELLSLQNNLSKPFPYIKEAAVTGNISNEDASSHGNGNIEESAGSDIVFPSTNYNNNEGAALGQGLGTGNSTPVGGSSPVKPLPPGHSSSIAPMKSNAVSVYP